MTTHYINLKEIDPNPYQTRLREDPEHVARVAESIADKGLLQTPIGRQVEGRVQLAFGHTRLAAYKLLHQNGMSHTPGQFERLPVQIAELTDLQMFEYGITENVQRAELTPTELAQAMQIYREDFGKTSAEIGKLFGLSESAVRNKIRLLDLPEGAKEQLDEGGITENTARKLLSMRRVAPEKVDQMAEKLSSGGFNTPEAVSEAIRHELRLRKDVKPMWEGKYATAHELACGGKGLWPLTWAQERQDVSVKIFLKAFPKWKEAMDKKIIAPRFQGCQRQLAAYPGSAAVAIHPYLSSGVPQEFVVNAYQLLRPPACTACEYYTAIDGTHYCGLIECWKLKREAWYEAELKRLAEELKVKVYDPATDGKDFEECDSWWNPEERNRYQKWVDEGADHLRLRVKYQGYNEHPVTASNCVELISVRAEAVKTRQEERERAIQREQENADRHDQWETQKKNQAQAREFVRQIGMAYFTAAFKPLEKGVLMDLARMETRWESEEDGDPLQVVTFYYVNLAISCKIEYQGVVATANFLNGLAKAWGIELPAEWDELAREFGSQAEEKE